MKKPRLNNGGRHNQKHLSLPQHKNQCLYCGSRMIGYISANRMYCAECFSEILINSCGRVTGIYSVQADGTLSRVG